MKIGDEQSNFKVCLLFGRIPVQIKLSNLVIMLKKRFEISLDYFKRQNREILLIRNLLENIIED